MGKVHPKRVKKFNKKKVEKELDKKWSEYVRKRDVFCKRCGGSRGFISAHHAFGRRHLATRWDIFNGVGLCYPCHIHWAHRDSAGFTEWFRVHVSEDQYNRLAEAHNMVVKFTTEDLIQILKNLEEL